MQGNYSCRCADGHLYCFTRAGIDRIVLKHIQIASIDEEKLERAWAAARKHQIQFSFQCDTHAAHVEIPLSNREGKIAMSALSMRDTAFKMFIKFQAYVNCYTCRLESKLEFSPKNVPDYGNNLINFDAASLFWHMEQIRIYLEEKYGIFIEMEESQIDEIELNTTFPLEYPFPTYRRPLLVFEGGFPYMKKVSEHKYFPDTETVAGSVTHLVVKIYNKSAQMGCVPDCGLEGGEVLDVTQGRRRGRNREKDQPGKHDLMRVEYTLQKEKVAEYFPKDELPGLKIVNLKDKYVREAFKKLTETYFFHPADQWERKSIKYAMSLVRSYCKNKRGAWQKDLILKLFDEELLQDQVMILHVSTILDGMTQVLGPEDKNRNLSRKRKAMKTAAADTVLGKYHDDEKFKEILQNLHAVCDA